MASETGGEVPTPDQNGPDPNVPNPYGQTPNPNVPTSYQYVQQINPPKPQRGMSVAGMVLGIVAWGVSIISFFILSPLSLLLSVIGLPLSILGLRKEPDGRGMAITGIVLNSIGVALALILTILVIIGQLTSQT